MRTDEHPDPTWPARFDEAAATDHADLFDVGDDLARGRTALRRRRVLVVSGGTLAAAVVLGTAMLAAPGGDVTRSVAPAGDGPAPSPTFQEPSTTLEPEDTGTPTPSTDLMADVEARMQDTQAWRDRLYAMAGEVLDPSGEHLNYDTNSMQGGSSGGGAISLGIKLGWTLPGAVGEGMVQISVTDATGPRSDESQMYLQAPLEERTLANGETVRVGERTDGAYAVAYRQPDGELVWVLWEPLFGNNSVTPVHDAGPRLRDVIRFVQDERLDLPPR